MCFLKTKCKCGTTSGQEHGAQILTDKCYFIIKSFYQYLTRRFYFTSCLAVSHTEILNPQWELMRASFYSC